MNRSIRKLLEESAQEVASNAPPPDFSKAIAAISKEVDGVIALFRKTQPYLTYSKQVVSSYDPKERALFVGCEVACGQYYVASSRKLTGYLQIAVGNVEHAFNQAMGTTTITDKSYYGYFAFKPVDGNKVLVGVNLIQEL